MSTSPTIDFTSLHVDKVGQKIQLKAKLSAIMILDHNGVANIKGVLRTMRDEMSDVVLRMIMAHR